MISSLSASSWLAIFCSHTKVWVGNSLTSNAIVWNCWSDASKSLLLVYNSRGWIFTIRTRLPLLNSPVLCNTLASGTFSKLTLIKVYVVHHGATTRIRIQENDLAYQAKNQTIKEKRRKDLLQKNEKENEAQEKIQLALDEALSSAVAMFLAEEGQEEIDRVAKVLRLSQIAIDLKKKH